MIFSQRNCDNYCEDLREGIHIHRKFSQIDSSNILCHDEEFQLLQNISSNSFYLSGFWFFLLINLYNPHFSLHHVPSRYIPQKFPSSVKNPPFATTKELFILEADIKSIQNFDHMYQVEGFQRFVRQLKAPLILAES